jgi:hypothetical protein
MDLAPFRTNAERSGFMRKFVLFMGLTVLTAGAFGCGHETRTVVRRETVTTDTVPAQPVVVEKRTVITPPPVVPEERVYQERRTTIENE